jgi:hypothetical protein
LDLFLASGAGLLDSLKNYPLAEGIEDLTASNSTCQQTQLVFASRLTENHSINTVALLIRNSAYPSTKLEQIKESEGFMFRSRNCKSSTVAIALFVNNLLSWFVVRRHWQPGFFSLYIDPGSGLLIWQLLVATAAGFVFSVREKIAHFFKQRRSAEKN